MIPQYMALVYFQRNRSGGLYEIDRKLAEFKASPATVAYWTEVKSHFKAMKAAKA